MSKSPERSKRPGGYCGPWISEEEFHEQARKVTYEELTKLVKQLDSNPRQYVKAQRKRIREEDSNSIFGLFRKAKRWAGGCSEADEVQGYLTELKSELLECYEVAYGPMSESSRLRSGAHKNANTTLWVDSTSQIHPREQLPALDKATDQSLRAVLSPIIESLEKARSESPHSAEDNASLAAVGEAMARSLHTSVSPCHTGNTVVDGSHTLQAKVSKELSILKESNAVSGSRRREGTSLHAKSNDGSGYKQDIYKAAETNCTQISAAQKQRPTLSTCNIETGDRVNSGRLREDFSNQNYMSEKSGVTHNKYAQKDHDLDAFCQAPVFKVPKLSLYPKLSPEETKYRDVGDNGKHKQDCRQGGIAERNRQLDSAPHASTYTSTIPSHHTESTLHSGQTQDKTRSACASLRVDNDSRGDEYTAAFKTVSTNIGAKEGHHREGLSKADDSLMLRRYSEYRRKNHPEVCTTRAEETACSRGPKVLEPQKQQTESKNEATNTGDVDVVADSDSEVEVEMTTEEQRLSSEAEALIASAERLLSGSDRHRDAKRTGLNSANPRSTVAISKDRDVSNPATANIPADAKIVSDIVYTNKVLPPKANVGFATRGTNIQPFEPTGKPEVVYSGVTGTKLFEHDVLHAKESMSGDIRDRVTKQARDTSGTTQSKNETVGIDKSLSKKVSTTTGSSTECIQAGIEANTRTRDDTANIVPNRKENSYTLVNTQKALLSPRSSLTVGQANVIKYARRDEMRVDKASYNRSLYDRQDSSSSSKGSCVDNDNPGSSQNGVGVGHIRGSSSGLQPTILGNMGTKQTADAVRQHTRREDNPDVPTDDLEEMRVQQIVDEAVNMLSQAEHSLLSAKNRRSSDTRSVPSKRPSFDVSILVTPAEEGEDGFINRNGDINSTYQKFDPTSAAPMIRGEEGVEHRAVREGDGMNQDSQTTQRGIAEVKPVSKAEDLKSGDNKRFTHCTEAKADVSMSGAGRTTQTHRPTGNSGNSILYTRADTTCKYIQQMDQHHTQGPSPGAYRPPSDITTARRYDNTVPLADKTLSYDYKGLRVDHVTGDVQPKSALPSVHSTAVSDTYTLRTVHTEMKVISAHGGVEMTADECTQNERRVTDRSTSTRSKSEIREVTDKADASLTDTSLTELELSFNRMLDTYRSPVEAQQSLKAVGKTQQVTNTSNPSASAGERTNIKPNHSSKHLDKMGRESIREVYPYAYTTTRQSKDRAQTGLEPIASGAPVITQPSVSTGDNAPTRISNTTTANEHVPGQKKSTPHHRAGVLIYPGQAHELTGVSTGVTDTHTSLLDESESRVNALAIAGRRTEVPRTCAVDKRASDCGDPEVQAKSVDGAKLSSEVICVKDESLRGKTTAGSEYATVQSTSAHLGTIGKVNTGSISSRYPWLKLVAERNANNSSQPHQTICSNFRTTQVAADSIEPLAAVHTVADPASTANRIAGYESLARLLTSGTTATSTAVKQNTIVEDTIHMEPRGTGPSATEIQSVTESKNEKTVKDCADATSSTSAGGIFSERQAHVLQVYTESDHRPDGSKNTVGMGGEIEQGVPPTTRYQLSTGSAPSDANASTEHTKASSVLPDQEVHLTDQKEGRSTPGRKRNKSSSKAVRKSRRLSGVAPMSEAEVVQKYDKTPLKSDTHDRGMTTRSGSRRVLRSSTKKLISAGAADHTDPRQATEVGGTSTQRKRRTKRGALVANSTPRVTRSTAKKLLSMRRVGGMEVEMDVNDSRDDLNCTVMQHPSVTVRKAKDVGASHKKRYRVGEIGADEPDQDAGVENGSDVRVPKQLALHANSEITEAVDSGDGLPKDTQIKAGTLQTTTIAPITRDSAQVSMSTCDKTNTAYTAPVLGRKQLNVPVSPRDEVGVQKKLSAESLIALIGRKLNGERVGQRRVSQQDLSEQGVPKIGRPGEGTRYSPRANDSERNVNANAAIDGVKSSDVREEGGRRLDRNGSEKENM